MMRRCAVAAGLAAALFGGMIGGQAAATESGRPADGCWDPLPCPTVLSEVDMLSAGAGWAVGEAGTILRWDGRYWRLQPSPTAHYLTTVAMLSPTDGWAGSYNGELLRWNGSQWTLYPLAVNSRIYDLAMLSPTDGWLAAGNSIWRWDGAQWTKRSDFGSYGISATGANDAWATGAVGTHFLRWDGSQWQQREGGIGSAYAMKMFAPNDVWAGGLTCSDKQCNIQYLGLSHWNGSAWTERMPQAQGAIYDIDGAAGNDVWAVGALENGRTPAIFHWNGSIVETLGTDRWLYGVSMVSADNGWAVGEQGRLLRWDGAAWTPYAPALPRAYLPLLGR